MLLELVSRRDRRVLFGKNIRQKLVLSAFRRVDRRHGEIQTRMMSKDAADLIQLDAVAANLRLPVEAAAKLDLPIRPPNSAIAAAIHAGIRRTRQKDRARKLRSVTSGRLRYPRPTPVPPI